MIRMRRGTKIGWILVAISIIMCTWVIVGGFTANAGLDIDDEGVVNVTGHETVTKTSFDGKKVAQIIVDEDGAIFSENACENFTDLTQLYSFGNISIGRSAFNGCTSLTSVTVNGSAALSGFAFNGCDSLSSVSFGSLSECGDNAFTGCQALDSITVRNGSSSGFHTVDGALYNGDTLIYVPSGMTELTVESTTKHIAKNAFIDSNVSVLTFNNASVLASVGDQGTYWPPCRNGQHITVNLNGVAEGDNTYAEEFFTQWRKTYGATLVEINFNGEHSDPAGDYTVTVYDIKYLADGTTQDGDPEVRGIHNYNYNDSYTFAAKTIDGYTCFAAENSSGVVTADVDVVFKYKPGTTPGPGPTPNPPSPTPGGGGSSGGGSSSGGGGGGSSASTPVKKPVETTTDATAGQPTVYQITSGADQSVANTAGIVSMTCNGPLDKFLYVMMDGKVIDKSYYATAEGSTILAFTADYVKALSTARHHVRLVYTDGYADTTLTINGGTKTTTTVTYTVSSDGTVSKGEHVKDSTPKTADGFDERYLLCLAIFFCGIGFILYSRTKKLEILSAGMND